VKKINKNDPLLKYGGYASIMTAIFVTVVIIANVIVSSFDIQFDLTNNGLYTLTEDTIDLVEGLEEDVNIYTLYANGYEQDVVPQIIDKYANYSDHIIIENVDPYADPGFVARYTRNNDSPTMGDVIVETLKDFVVIPYDKLTDYSVNEQTQTTYVKGVRVEGVLTGTIRRLTKGTAEMVYELTGHGEYALGEGLKQELGYSGYDVEVLDYLIAGYIPEDCRVLVINGPTQDISEEEYDDIKAYLENGGRAFITLPFDVKEFPNFDKLLAGYGIANSREIVIEGTASSVINNNPVYIIPQINDTSIIGASMASAGVKALTPITLGIERLDTKRGTTYIDTVASSSVYSYAKDIAEVTTSSAGMAEGDTVGPIDLVVAITDTDNAGNKFGTKLVVAGTSMILEDDINTITNGGNFGLVMNAFDYLTESEMSNRTKSIVAEEYLNMTQSTGIIIILICVFVIPLSILIAGFVVFFRRKNR